MVSPVKTLEVCGEVMKYRPRCVSWPVPSDTTATTGKLDRSAETVTPVQEPLSGTLFAPAIGAVTIVENTSRERAKRIARIEASRGRHRVMIVAAADASTIATAPLAVSRPHIMEVSGSAT